MAEQNDPSQPPDDWSPTQAVDALDGAFANAFIGVTKPAS